MTIGLLLANVMSGLDATIINTALPAIIADLHGISCMGLIVSVFLLGMSVSTLLWSKFGERMGNKKAFVPKGFFIRLLDILLILTHK